MIQHPRLIAFAIASFLVFSAAASFGQKMYWLTQDKIQRADLDGSNAEVLVTNEFTHSPDFALDRSAGKIYWIDGRRIRRANLDGSGIEDVLDTPLARPRTIAVESKEGKLYWFDFVSDSILRANVDGSHIETIVVLSGTNLIALSVDAPGMKMYWVDDRWHVIQRANLGGSNIETLVAEEKGSQPLSIAIDSQGGKMYWTDHLRDEIRRANLDGSEVEIIGAEIDGWATIDLDTASGKMYWTVGGSNSRKGAIQRANLDGTNVETVLVSRFIRPFGDFPNVIALDPMMEKMYWIEKRNSRVQRADLDGTDVETILRLRFGRPSGLTLDLSSEYVYWTDQSVIAEFILQRAKLDGSSVEELIATDVQTTQAIAVALDRVAKKVYWLQSNNSGMIRRANYDGSNIEDVLIGAFWVKGRLALDAAAGKIYWTDVAGARNPPTVFRRANLDGTDLEVLLTMELSEDIGFTLDLIARKMYWAGGKQVFRSNLDGTAVENLVPRGSGLSHAMLGLAVDPVNSKLYWINNRKIQRANLDGSDIEDLVVDSQPAFGIALDLGCGGVDCQANGVGDECEADTDEDGLIDDCDTCPSSDLRSSVFVNACDTLVPNQLLDNGCTMNDRIGLCPNQDDRRHDFQRCVGSLARSWRRRGLITGRQMGMILRCIVRKWIKE